MFYKFRWKILIFNFTPLNTSTHLCQKSSSISVLLANLCVLHDYGHMISLLQLMRVCVEVSPPVTCPEDSRPRGMDTHPWNRDITPAKADKGTLTPIRGYLTPMKGHLPKLKFQCCWGEWPLWRGECPSVGASGPFYDLSVMVRVSIWGLPHKPYSYPSNAY